MHTAWISKARLETLAVLCKFLIGHELCSIVAVSVSILSCTSFPGSMAFSNAIFGSGTGPIFLDNVDCVGNETSLLECSGRPLGEHNCRHTEDASISCSCMYITLCNS